MVKSVERKLDIHTLAFANTEAGALVQLNEIAEVTIKTAQPIQFDSYSANWTTGAAVLVDSQTNMTSAALMFTEIAE
jgi:sulfate adenylyltransferase subunit 1